MPSLIAINHLHHHHRSVTESKLSRAKHDVFYPTCAVRKGIKESNESSEKDSAVLYLNDMLGNGRSYCVSSETIESSAIELQAEHQ
jgi:hypothetical protein